MYHMPFGIVPKAHSFPLWAEAVLLQYYQTILTMSDDLCSTNSGESIESEPPSDSELQQPARSQARPRSVSFSEYSQAIIIPEDDTESKSYSQEDILLFQQAAISDVQRLRHELGSLSPEEMMSNDCMYDCVGLEKFISPALHRRTIDAMHDHVDAVLEEQELQGEEIDFLRVEALAARSESSSAWARSRAEEVAAGYLRLQE